MGFKNFRRNKLISLINPLVKESDKVLDVGCADGWLLNSLKVKRKVGIDIEKHPKLETNKTPYGVQIEYFHASIEKMPFENNSFDVIVLNAIMEHLNTIQGINGLIECKRVLKKNGKMVIWMPTPHSDWVLKFLFIIGQIGPFNHVKYYGLKEFAKILKELDFNVLKNDYQNLTMNIFFVSEKNNKKRKKNE